jgi:hypothetical protein
MDVTCLTFYITPLGTIGGILLVRWKVTHDQQVIQVHSRLGQKLPYHVRQAGSLAGWLLAGSESSQDSVCLRFEAESENLRSSHGLEIKNWPPDTVAR